MTTHEAQEAQDLRALLAEAGYNEGADFVPSASGGPIRTSQASDAFRVSAKQVFGEAFELVQKELDALDAADQSGTSTVPGSRTVRSP